MTRRKPAINVAAHNYCRYLMASVSGKSHRFQEAVNRLRENDPSLVHLDLANSHITWFNLIELCYLLANNTFVQSLDVSGNDIDDNGARELASNDTLISLNVSSNHITTPGAIALANNASLKSLDASNNHIGNKGATTFALKNKTLKSLDLSNNPIDDIAFLAFADNKSLLSFLATPQGSNKVATTLFIKNFIASNRLPRAFNAFSSILGAGKIPVELMQEIGSFLIPEKNVLNVIEAAKHRQVRFTASPLTRMGFFDASELDTSPVAANRTKPAPSVQAALTNRVCAN